MKARRLLALVMALAMVLSLCALPAMAEEPEDGIMLISANTNDPLSIENGKETSLNVTLDGKNLSVTMIEDDYCANPNSAEQKISIYIPENATSDSAVLLCVNNAGWQSDKYADRTKVEDGKAYVSTSDTDKIGAAFARGMIIVSYGCRSRNDAATDGEYLGHSPATMTDTKAAIRYIRYNEIGDPDRIVITGTSGGGGLSVQLASSGNSSDYYESLYEIGAAGIEKNADGTYASTISDAVTATIAYCPINDLGNANAGYEATYNSIRQTLADNNIPQGQSATYDAAAIIAASNELSKEYGEYIDSLKLPGLTSANLAEASAALIKAEIEESIAEYGVEKMMADLDAFIYSANNPTRKPFMTADPPAKTPEDPTYLSGYDFLTLNADGTYSYDFTKHITFLATSTELKPAPSFSNKGISSVATMMNEDSLYGTREYAYSAFCEYSWNNDDTAGNGCGTDDTNLTWDEYLKTDDGKALSLQLKMASPIPYLTASESDVAPYWYVRHGMADRDTSFAVQTVLYYAMKNNSEIEDLSFEFAWFKPHSGDYDVQEAYAWLDSVIGTSPKGSAADPLAIADATITKFTVKLDGVDLGITEYEDTYVTNPSCVATDGNGENDQRISIYVPSNVESDAAVYLMVNNAGWLADSYAKRTQITAGKEYSSDSYTDNVGAALARGMIVVSYGCRGRNDNTAADGSHICHSPATMTDTKAAIRYLRYNEIGDPDRIVVTGTSGGGALSTLIASSGDSADFYESLYEIGAAGIEKKVDGTYASTISDAVSAVIAYCPITDLGNADQAYEWLYGETRQAYAGAKLSLSEVSPTTGMGTPTSVEQVYGDSVLAASKELAADYVKYIDSLGLKDENGNTLKASDGTFLAAIQGLLEEGVEKEFTTEYPSSSDAPKDGDYSWLTIKDGVASINMKDYLYYIGTKMTGLKTAPAFGNKATENEVMLNENNIFGGVEDAYSANEFWAWNNNNVSGDGIGTDDTNLTWDQYMNTDAGKYLALQIKMTNAVAYVNEGTANIADNWYVRHGMADRDTSFAVESTLYYSLLNCSKVSNLDFSFAWLKPHSGNYDVKEAFAWLDGAIGTSVRFADVANDAWYADAVEWAVANNVTVGTSATTFSPKNTLTVAGMVQFLYNQAGQPEVEPNGTDWFANARAWGLKEGYLDKTTAASATNTQCTRIMVVDMMYKAANSPACDAANPFTDTTSASAIWAASKEITAGTSATTFTPEGNVTRAQAVQFIYNAFGR